MFCEGSTKGEVILTSYDKVQTKIISHAPPLSVQIINHSMIPDGQCESNYYNINYSFDYKYPSLNSPTATYTGNTVLMGKIGGIRIIQELPRPVSAKVQIYCRNVDGKYFWFTVHNYSRDLGYQEIFNARINSLTIQSSSSFCGGTYPHQVIISDVSGIIYNSGYVFHNDTWHPPTYNVVCGDNCPEGSCKCKTNTYPYYCCLDCSKVERRLNSLVNLAREISNE